MGAVSCLLGIKSPHAFLQSQKTLVDLCPLLLSVFVVRLAVLSSLTTSQIYKQKLARVLNPLLMDLDLTDCVTPT
jgi:hypothetical protein